MDSSSAEKIVLTESEAIAKAKFRSGEYFLQRIPCALYLKHSQVYRMGSDVCNEDVHALQTAIPSLKGLKIQKLKVNFYYLSELRIGVISKMFFNSRRDIDEQTFKAWFSDDTSRISKKKRVDKSVSFGDTLKKFHCKISCNMKYYLSHKHVLESDLNEVLDNFQPKSASYVRKLEKKLLFKLLMNIFGDQNDEKEHKDQTIFFKDFYMLLDWSEYKIATAERGDYYITFAYNQN